MTVREALNSAIDEEMERDPDVLILGEEVTTDTPSKTLFRNPRKHSVVISVCLPSIYDGPTCPGILGYPFSPAPPLVFAAQTSCYP